MTPIAASLALLVSLAVPRPGGEGGEAAPPSEVPQEVRLVVLVVIDQLIPEQLARLEPWLDGGLGRFRDGQVWWRAVHDHSSTETGPGHATLGTGLTPSGHGIVRNSWRERASGERMYCVEDPEAGLLSNAGVGPGGSSPANLLAPALADHLRAHTRSSRSIGLSGKDRAAILTTGHAADWALWWDTDGGGFVSSTHYGVELPAWIADWNEGWTLEADGFPWTDELPDGIEAAGTAADERPGEPAGGAAFPHRAPSLSGDPSGPERAALARWARSSPLVDRFAIELAETALDEMDLGGDEHVDYLFLGLSGCDIVGHAYGPYSREVTDLLLRVDDALGELFEVIDARVGEKRWIAALSSDHGVLELPEALAARGFDAGRIDGRVLGAALGELRSNLTDVLGADYVRALDPAEILLDEERLIADGVDLVEARALAAEVAADVLPGVQRVFTRDQLVAAHAGDGTLDPLLGTLARSFHPERSGDVWVVYAPWHLLQPAGTSHGSPWPYDRVVPMAFIGPGFASGSRYEPCRTVDLVPTLLHRAGVPVPEELPGRVLE